jgi:asparagine synthetase B (glutamine-hydrolysing)
MNFTWTWDEIRRLSVAERLQLVEDIWDSIARRLFLARDPYGIKPLYTANDGWTFRFASQVKALLAGGQVSHDPEPAGLVGFHLFGSVPEPFTLYRDIRALPAGHIQWVDAAGPRIPPDARSEAEIGNQPQRTPRDAEQLAQDLRDQVCMDATHSRQ